jgi:uncharacterized membrane protein
MSSGLTILLAAATAFFFVVTSWAMKSLEATSATWLLPLILTFLLLAGWLEFEALRASKLGSVVIVILAFEIVMTFAVACIFLGEHYSLREVTAVLITIGGMTLLSLGETNVAASTDEDQTALKLPREITMPAPQHPAILFLPSTQGMHRQL